MKILPREYAKAQGQPFRVEDYKGAKLEMYYLDDRSDYGKFAQRGRFSVWTSNGVDYRLFVDKGYYNAVEDLYKNEVNTIWLDFTNSIYGEHKKMSKFFMLIQLGLFVVAFAALMFLPMAFPAAGDIIFLVVMVLMFVGIMTSSQIQQKKLKALVAKENEKASTLIKQELGEEHFKEILAKQEKYYESYFKPSVDEEVTEEIETENNEEENTGENNE
ncbi:hypothetical protein [Acholeplasma hippikon]|uniref:Uncharacterized protein n=1 Tax=Acholeplasma hippikon TaxID=264636 RepID=A0A449BKK7_9MOLU|nr:hypothetical protein [Acholeplasma hippikon]VEU82989.1 Uncharacterised protein [Acholeplasma hippikon]